LSCSRVGVSSFPEILFGVEGNAVGIRGSDRLDYGQLARALEVRRNDLKLADAAEVENLLGFEAGGVAPFALAGAELYADEALWKLELIYTGMGRRDRTLELKVSDYLILESPQKIQVAKS
jgi:prolyl-tRNA editing enzyme YbaK/EbsC (Cys-tRNA(Pro) deacylase)